MASIVFWCFLPTGSNRRLNVLVLDHLDRGMSRGMELATVKMSRQFDISPCLIGQTRRNYKLINHTWLYFLNYRCASYKSTTSWKLINHTWLYFLNYRCASYKSTTSWKLINHTWLYFLNYRCASYKSTTSWKLINHTWLYFLNYRCASYKSTTSWKLIPHFSTFWTIGVLATNLQLVESWYLTFLLSEL